MTINFKKDCVTMKTTLLLCCLLVFSQQIQAQTQKKVAVILINFENYPTTFNLTPDDARSDVFTRNDPYGYGQNSVNAYYQEESYGKLSLTGALRPDGDVFGWYTIPNSVFSYPSTTCRSVAPAAAETMAQADGFVRSNYDDIIYVFPSGSCGGGNAGYASSPGIVYINLGLNGANRGFLTAALVGHELGHAFSLHHAHAIRCTDLKTGALVPISNSCQDINPGYGDSYGDIFDIMATGGAHQMNAYEKESQNTGSWFDPANVQTVTTSGYYTIGPYELPASDVKYLKIPRDTGSYWYLEFRQNYGFDQFGTDAPVTKGVSIRLAPDPTYGSVGPASALIDTTPGSRDTTNDSTADVWDGALAVGNTFTDPDYGISVTTLSVSSAGATVNVSFDPAACVLRSPSISITPSNQSAQAKSTLTYTVTVTNRNIIACPAQAYVVVPKLPSRWSQTPGSYTVTLGYGASDTRAVAITSSGNAKLGIYTVSEKANLSQKIYSQRDAVYSVTQ